MSNLDIIFCAIAKHVHVFYEALRRFLNSTVRISTLISPLMTPSTLRSSLVKSRGVFQTKDDLIFLNQALALNSNWVEGPKKIVSCRFVF